MEDVEREDLFRFGHDVDTIQIRLELYRLATMFLSSGPIAEFSLEGHRTGRGMIDLDTHWLEELGSQFFRGETSRILIYTAIQGRILYYIRCWRSVPIWDEVCGHLEEASRIEESSFGAGPLGGTVKPLTLRETFNKIIHSVTINGNEETITNSKLFGPKRINPILYLYGKLHGKPWRATLEIIEYVHLMRKIIVAVGG